MPNIMAFVGDSYAQAPNHPLVNQWFASCSFWGIPGLPVYDAELPRQLNWASSFQTALWAPCTEMQGIKRITEIIPLLEKSPSERSCLTFTGSDRYAYRLDYLSELTDSQRQELRNTRLKLLNSFLEIIDFYLTKYPTITLFPMATRWYGSRWPNWLVGDRNSYQEIVNKFGSRVFNIDPFFTDPTHFQDEQGHLSLDGWKLLRQLIIESNAKNLKG